MILVAGHVQPIRFTNPKTNKVDEVYPLFAVKDALRDLQGIDVRLQYESLTVIAGMDDATRVKADDVTLRLLKRQQKRKAI
jgi:hypothetical protein